VAGRAGRGAGIPAWDAAGAGGAVGAVMRQGSRKAVCFRTFAPPCSPMCPLLRWECSLGHAADGGALTLIR